MNLPRGSRDVLAGGWDEDGGDGAVGVGEAVAQAHARAEAAAEVLGHETVDNGVQAAATNNKSWSEIFLVDPVNEFREKRNYRYFCNFAVEKCRNFRYRFI